MADELRTAMRAYFDALLGEWRTTNGSLPKTPWIEEVDPAIYVGQPDEAQWIEWLPTEKTTRDDFGKIEAAFGIQVHPSVKEYFDSFWFCSLGGTFRGRAVQLEPMMPGIGLDEWEQKLRRYRDAHGGSLGHLPIGLESTQSLLLVVDNRTGEVKVEDYELGSLEALAGNLSELVKGLK